MCRPDALNGQHPPQLKQLCFDTAGAVSEQEPLTVIEESADTYHDHIHQGQDKSENVPKRPLNAAPEGESYVICVKNVILPTDHVFVALGRCILKKFRDIFRFILASVYIVLARVCSISSIDAR